VEFRSAHVMPSWMEPMGLNAPGGGKAGLTYAEVQASRAPIGMSHGSQAALGLSESSPRALRVYNPGEAKSGIRAPGQAASK